MLSIRDRYKSFLRDWKDSREYFLFWGVNLASQFAEEIGESFEVRESEERDEIRRVIEGVDEGKFESLKFVVRDVNVGRVKRKIWLKNSYFQITGDSIYFPEVASVMEGGYRASCLTEFQNNPVYLGVIFSLWKTLELPEIEELTYLFKVFQEGIKTQEVEFTGRQANSKVVATGSGLAILKGGTLYGFDGKRLSGIGPYQEIEI